MDETKLIAATISCIPKKTNNLPIGSNDDGEREAERDDLLLVVGAEGPNSADGQLVDRGHLLAILPAPPTLVAKSAISRR